MGNPDLYVHPNEFPNKLEDYMFTTKEEGEEILTITPEDRARFSPSGQVVKSYKIAIQAVHSGATYSLEVYLNNK